MKTRDFREIQVSSTLLVVIFLCVLVLGVFIFLLGVSVGKKQVQIAAATKVVTPQVQETEKEPEALTPPATEPAQSNSLAAEQPSAAPSQANPQAPAPGGGKAPGEEAGRKPSVKPGEKPAPKSEVKPPSPAGQQPAVAGAGLYYVQVAAFMDKASAEAEAGKFRKRGYTAVVAPPRSSDMKTWYRVCLGGFATRAKAAELLGQLNQSAKKKTGYLIFKF